MPLPNFEEFKEILVRVKRSDQPWGNLFREITNDTIAKDGFDEKDASLLLANKSLINVLAEWDFYSSAFLDKAAADCGVKSWQVTEYIEALREALSISETDLIVYENKADHNTVPKFSSEKVGPDEQVFNQTHNDPPQHQSGSRTPYFTEEPPRVKANGVGGGPSKTILGLTGLVSALAVVLVVLIATVVNQKSASIPPFSNNPEGSDRSSPSSGTDNSQSSPPKTSSEEVYFSGIDLPVTNTLCNKKRSFCIYNLATLVNKETGEATYSFSDVANGQQVNINGVITVSNIERDGSNRKFTFAFRDDQNNTTPGWAAAGYFNLDQDTNPSKQGILTRFKTTESFGPKTPVGLENTSYLFPS